MPQTPPFPLGPTLTDTGIHFALYSENATGVELCLFETASSETESQCLALEKEDDAVWRIHVPDLKPGCLYAYRVHGLYRPDQGHRFNPSKLLIDPRAKALGRPMHWHKALCSVPPGAEDQHDLPPDTRDSAAYAPLGKVIDLPFDWGDDRPPAIPWEETIIYETHVKGMTQQHPGVPENLRGTYAGLASEPVLDHLTRLGITAIELLPVHQIADEYHLHANGLSNYWGYNPLLFFAPDIRLARQDTDTPDPVTEFKHMVQTFHRAGIEVILDLVFNHTAEGDLHGPTVSFRGIDNAVYYRTDPEHPERYINFTGCGNTFNLHHPQARQLVLDALRYWVEDMHVDGFRLDLAVTVGRGLKSFEPGGEFFKAIREDPVLCRVKWIAEPWDLGPDGYQLSNFPKEWSEWNDQYRQTIRKVGRGDSHQAASFTQRVSGSLDLFGSRGRPLHATVNYITSHDGFTLEDLVTYEHKHNEANGENNQDGSNGNDSCNYGMEGPSEDPHLNSLRRQQKRNFMATLLLSAGTPMISGGDEIGRTQQGNNNAYCQDNPISWYDWNLDANQKGFLEFVRSLTALRKQRVFVKGEGHWFQADGQPLNTETEESGDLSALAWVSGGNQTPVLAFLWNWGNETREFTLPGESRTWTALFDSTEPANTQHASAKPLKNLSIAPRSLTVLSGKSKTSEPQKQD